MKKTILITGASRGFGKLAAVELKNRGHEVYGTSRNPEKYDTDYELLQMDVGNQSSIKTVVDSIIKKSGKIDVVINNAGTLLYGALEEASEEEIKEIFDVNFYGVIRVINEVLPHMRKRKQGRIISVSSGAGIIETPTFGFYCASKHALEGYMKSLMHEVLPFNIDVALLKPGEYKTEIFKGAKYSKNKIEDYTRLREAMTKQIGHRKEGAIADPTEVGVLLADMAETKNLKLHNGIGKYLKILPILNLFPSLLHKIVQKEFNLK